MIRRTPASERGFTLVEMIVGLVLSGIVLALLLTVVVRMLDGSDRTTQRVKAQRAAVSAFELLGSDLRAAQSPDRVPSKFGSIERLRAIIRDFHEDPSIDLRDIVDADADSILFYADVVTGSPSAECVSWAVQRDGSLTRDVWAYRRGCTGLRAPGGLQHAVVMPAAASGAVGSTRMTAPFTYRLTINPGDPTIPNCITNTTQDPKNGADPERRLNSIVSVTMDLRAFVVGHVARGDQDLVGSTAIGSRSSYEYRYALGCAA